MSINTTEASAQAEAVATKQLVPYASVSWDGQLSEEGQMGYTDKTQSIWQPELESNSDNGIGVVLSHYPACVMKQIVMLWGDVCYLAC